MRNSVLVLFSSVALVAQPIAAQSSSGGAWTGAGIGRYAVIARGSRTIPAGTTTGAILVLHGNLDVYGDIAGAATTVGGDVIVHPGGRIRGAAVAMFGQVRNEGGSILGVIKHVGRNGVSTRLSYGGRPPSTFRSLRSAIIWLVVLLLLGAWALFYASAQLKRVVTTVMNEMPRSLITGVLGGIATIPLLIALVVAMAITIIGIIFIPIGVMGFLIVLWGMGLLGFLAVAQVTGIAISGDSPGTETPAGNELRYLVTGILAFSALWIVAAAFTWLPVVGVILRVLAASITMVAVATGFGAVLTSLWRVRKERKAAASPLTAT
jgi:hypothetical protein